MPPINVKVWNLPCIAGTLYLSLQDLVLGKGGVYYANPSAEEFGELDPNSNRVREWQLPNSLWAVPGSPYPAPHGDPQGICLGPDGTLWGRFKKPGGWLHSISTLVTLDATEGGFLKPIPIRSHYRGE